MKLLPDKLGGSQKQYAMLGGLLVLGLVSYFLNRTPSGPAPITTARPIGGTPDPTVPKVPPVAKRAPKRGANSLAQNFQPTIKPPEGTDITKIDPTIKNDLLAKVREVEMPSGSRGSVFAFGTAPPPPTQKVDPIKPGQMQTAKNNDAQEQPAKPPEDAAPPKPAAPPGAPPIPLKFFGYSTPRSGGPKRAFFLDGEDIQVVNENEVIKNRYKVVRIGVNSVVVEDLNFKSEQTLPLVEELAG